MITGPRRAGRSFDRAARSSMYSYRSMFEGTTQAERRALRSTLAESAQPRLRRHEIVTGCIFSAAFNGKSFISHKAAEEPLNNMQMDIKMSEGRQGRA